MTYYCSCVPREQPLKNNLEYSTEIDEIYEHIGYRSCFLTGAATAG